MSRTRTSSSISSMGFRGLGHDHHWYALSTAIARRPEVEAPADPFDSGNVQVDPRHLASPHDRYIPDHSPETIASYALLYSSMISSVPVDQPKPIGLVQLSHPGLQSSSTIGFSRWPWSPAVAPISSRPDMGSSLTGWLIARAVWPVKSRKLGTEEWMEVVDRFTTAARIMHEAGWDGVQIHSAHGYLLAEFLSPLVSHMNSNRLQTIEDHC
jgi:hypothetical protein